MIVLSPFVVLSVLVDFGDDDSIVLVTGVESVVVVGNSPFRTLLIVFNSGYFPCWQTPRKSSVSIDQIITPPICSSTACFTLSATLSTSS